LVFEDGGQELVSAFGQDVDHVFVPNKPIIHSQKVVIVIIEIDQLWQPVQKAVTSLKNPEQNTRNFLRKWRFVVEPMVQFQNGQRLSKSSILIKDQHLIKNVS
jgi:hypothetical protein